MKNTIKIFSDNNCYLLSSWYSLFLKLIQVLIHIKPIKNKFIFYYINHKIVIVNSKGNTSLQQQNSLAGEKIMISLIVPQTAGIFCDKLHVIFICMFYNCLKYLISRIHIVRNFRGFACRCFQGTINLLNGHKFKLFCPEYWF